VILSELIGCQFRARPGTEGTTVKTSYVFAGLISSYAWIANLQALECGLMFVLVSSEALSRHSQKKWQCNQDN
jgi:hypothetical protein